MERLLPYRANAFEVPAIKFYDIKSLALGLTNTQRTNLPFSPTDDMPRVSTIGAELIIVSDIHIRYPDEIRYQILLQLIGQIDANTCKRFFLLGDIFDFCFGQSPYCQTLFRSLGDALETLIRKGVEVIYLEGNHEFSMRDIGWRGVTFLTNRNYQFSLGQQKLAITHGDLLNAPWHYYLFRAFIKSRFVAFCCRRLVPQKWFYELSLSFAKYSRGQDDVRSLNHQRILNAAKTWLMQEARQIGFFGHFHVPYFYHDHDQDLTLMSCLSWDHPNVMAYHSEKGFFRYVFDHDHNDFREEPALPFSG